MTAGTSFPRIAGDFERDIEVEAVRRLPPFTVAHDVFGDLMPTQGNRAARSGTIADLACALHHPDTRTIGEPPRLVPGRRYRLRVTELNFLHRRSDMAEKPTHTAGNRENRKAEERYRKGVRKTTEELGEDERGKRAREVGRKDLEKDRQAEEKGKSRARE